ncbi:MAG: DUF86 domain-containing protein [Bacillota bacterium]|nr:DUF86 domain-containing protein [Bacillota bacterium]
MLKYEPAVITRHLSELQNALTLLNDLKERDLQDFKKDRHLVGSAKYHLIVATEAVIDICNHLISKNKFRIPESYSDTFRVMVEEKILPVELAEEKLVAMARFRNRLVHIYWEIDLDMIYQILGENLIDLEHFISAIKKKIDES